MHSFDALVLLVSIPSEISIFSYCSIFIIHTKRCLKKLADKHSVLPPPLGSGGDDFCVISQAGGQLLNFKSQGGDTMRGGKIILDSQAGGGLLYHDELLVFPQNASP